VVNVEIKDFVYNSAIIGVAVNLITLLTMVIIAMHFASLIKNTPSYIGWFLLLNLGMSVGFILDASNVFNVKEIDDMWFMWSTFAIGTAIYLIILAIILLAATGVHPFSLLGTPPLPVSVMVVVSSIPVVAILMATLAYIFELMQRVG
jgi:hypothetical protein